MSNSTSTPWIPLTLVALLGLSATLAVAGEEFSPYWHDGQAEIDAYELDFARYGQTRHGRAILIYVTEPFRQSTLVKADDPSQDPGDVVDVLKLNLVRDFQTGIYDYNTMSSLFCRTSDFAPLKNSFSSAEWCGHVYSESSVTGDSVLTTIRSYFEGENARHASPRPARGLLEEELFVRLRGLRGEFLAEGEEVTLPVMTSALVQRLLHRKPQWQDATLRRLENRSVKVPAGNFDCIVYTISLDDGRSGRFELERAWPHRIVRWSLAPDVEGRLVGSRRSAYWQQNREGDESLLEELGLTPLTGP